MKAKRRKADEYRREAKKSKSEEEKKGLVAKAEACIKAASDIKVRFMLVSSRVVSRMDNGRIVFTSHQSQSSTLKVPEMPEVRVREWLPYNNYDVPDVVEAREISWSVPTLQRYLTPSSFQCDGNRES